MGVCVCVCVYGFDTRSENGRLITMHDAHTGAGAGVEDKHVLRNTLCIIALEFTPKVTHFTLKTII